MKYTVYKFQDTHDGNYSFIIAFDLVQATFKMYQSTSLKFTFVSSKPLEELIPFIVRNYILPF